jgi:hypothetical protein
VGGRGAERKRETSGIGARFRCKPARKTLHPFRPRHRQNAASDIGWNILKFQRKTLHPKGRNKWRYNAQSAIKSSADSRSVLARI